MGRTIATRWSTTGLVAAAMLGVYALVMLGAALSVGDALANCAGWPTCDGRWIVAPDDPAAIAMAHRLLAILVGLILLAAVIQAFRADTSRRVRWLLLFALVLFPAQGLLGRYVALGMEAGPPSWLHLGGGIAIFSMLVVSLAWLLESKYVPLACALSREIETSQDPSLGGTSVIRAYIELTKPRLMWLLCLVAAAGMALAAGPALDVVTIVATLGGGVLAIGASGTFNHVLERDIDRRMARTADRPIATDQIPVRNAIGFGVTLVALSMAVLLIFVNVVAAALTLAAVAFYSVVYTLVLKPNTVQNTAIGGVAGALPALIGWAAVTGGIHVPGLVLALVVFCWTPAHFYNLAMAYREDYAAGGFPMLPVVRGDRVAKRHVVYWAGATMIMAAALATTATLGVLYALVGLVAAAGFVYMIFQLHHRSDRQTAIRTFHASNAYLGMLLVIVVIDALLL